jgi:hypothetical protein
LINYAAIDGNTSSGASDNDFVNNKLVKPTRLTSTKSSKPGILIDIKLSKKSKLIEQKTISDRQSKV